MSRTIKWREYLIEQLAKDRQEAFGYIQCALEEYQVDGDTFVFLVALRTFVASQGGVTKLAKQTQLAPQRLQQMLSGDEAPPLDTLATLLNTLGCKPVAIRRSQPTDLATLLNTLGCKLTLEPCAEATPAAEAARERVENVA